MKIANKILLAALFGLAPVAAFADPVAGQAPVVPPPAMAAMPVPAAPAGADMEKAINKMEDKAVSDGKNAIKTLDTASDPLTLEDLNNTRQTVARIDAMIDVEKRLAELQKARKERDGGEANLASAIPASALMPPRAAPAPMNIQASEMQPVIQFRPKSMDEVVRIFGTDGTYAAVLKSADGNEHTVHVGDEVSHDVKVLWITPAAVGVSDNGDSRTLHVKNVDMVYSTVH